MKRRLLPSLLLALALALTACASKPAAPTATDFEVQPGEYRYQDSDIFFVETEKGNYYMNPSGDGVIHFAEPGSHEFHVLCNKPNCGHASADCNAFLEVAFGYYNGHLYGVTLQDQFELIQMDMDGTNHRVVTQLPEQKDLSGGFSGGGSYFFDNGYLIFLAFPCTSNPDYALPVYKIQLETGETTQLFQEDIPLYTVWPADGVSISNGYIYFPMPQAGTSECAFAEGNLETGRIELVFEDWNEMNSAVVNFDNVLYYHHAGVGLCEYDKATGTETVKVPMDVYYASVLIPRIIFSCGRGILPISISASCWHTTGTTIFWESWNWRRSVCGSPSWNTPPPMPFTSPPTAGPSPTTSTPITWTARS